MQKKVKVSALTGRALDWVVAKCIERDDASQIRWDNDGDPLGPIFDANCGGYPVYEPSDDWAQGGPIIDKAFITVAADSDFRQWTAECNTGNFHNRQSGPTALVAAMRCYVVAELGEEIEVPQEVLA